MLQLFLSRLLLLFSSALFSEYSFPANCRYISHFTAVFAAVVVFAEENGKSEEELIRALMLSHLTVIYINKFGTFVCFVWLCGSCHRFQLWNHLVNGRKLQSGCFRCSKHDCQFDRNDLWRCKTELCLEGNHRSFDSRTVCHDGNGRPLCDFRKKEL